MVPLQINCIKKIQKIAIIFFLLLCNFWLAGCKSSTTKPIDIEPSLRETIYAYYKAEKEGNWNQTYNYRNEDFKRVVPLEFYTKQMTIDNEGWELLSFEIISATREDEGRYSIKIKFCEQTPPGYTFDKIKAKRVVVTQNTKWIQKDGIWYCQDAGSRGHLSQNHDLSPREVDEFQAE